MNGLPDTQLTARKRTRQNTTAPVPFDGLAQQALEADAMRVRQGSQLIFLFCAQFMLVNSTEIYVAAVLTTCCSNHEECHYQWQLHVAR